MHTKCRHMRVRRHKEEEGRTRSAGPRARGATRRRRTAKSRRHDEPPRTTPRPPKGRRRPSIFVAADGVSREMWYSRRLSPTGSPLGKIRGTDPPWRPSAWRRKLLHQSSVWDGAESFFWRENEEGGGQDQRRRKFKNKNSTQFHTFEGYL